MSDVFISHVEEDKDIAREIARGLEAAGYTTWCYEDDSYPGPDYTDQMFKAIEESQAVVVVISPDSLGSDQVEDEVKWAREQRKRRVPLLKGISWAEFRNRRPKWAGVLGTAAAGEISSAGVGAILPRVIRGLQELGVKASQADAAEHAEADRKARERAEQERREGERAEAERQAREKAEAERKAREKAEQDRLAREKADAERRAAEHAEADRKARERAEQERREGERAEAERKARERAETERKAAEKAEQKRQANQKPEAERLAAQHVFISHVKEDMDIALEIARGLNATGYTTWCYEENSEPGVSYLKQIGEAIRSSQAVVLVVSRESLGSEGVSKDIEQSHDLAIPFVPVLRGISHVEFQNRRPKWRVALGTASTISIPPGGASAILPRIVRGLQGLGVKPTIAPAAGEVEADRGVREKTEQERPAREKTNLERRAPAALVAGTMRENPRDGLKYVWIPPGTFMMGCSPGDSECSDEEKPSHQVRISKGFWLGQTPVTVAAYKRFAQETSAEMPSPPNFNPAWKNEQMPIVNVTWRDAQAYCAWAGGRMPTEAEWEYAARGGSTEARYGPLDEIAWYSNNSGGGTHDVGPKRPNSFGLYDTLGNVWEWVNDWYDEKYYQKNPAVDPPGPSSGQYRVLRGGSWSVLPMDVRVSLRGRYSPGGRYYYFGFRCVGELGSP